MANAYHLGKHEKVGCYFCMREQCYAQYGHGEAYLADAGHSPCDGNANYVCDMHLDEGTRIFANAFGD